MPPLPPSSSFSPSPYSPSHSPPSPTPSLVMAMSSSALSLIQPPPPSPPASPTPFAENFYADEIEEPARQTYRVKLAAAISETRKEEQRERVERKRHSQARVQKARPRSAAAGARARTFDTAASRRRETAQRKMYSTDSRQPSQTTITESHAKLLSSSG